MWRTSIPALRAISTKPVAAGAGLIADDLRPIHAATASATTATGTIDTRLRLRDLNGGNSPSSF
jgi:hypothetical protein